MWSCAIQVIPVLLGCSLVARAGLSDQTRRLENSVTKSIADDKYSVLVEFEDDMVLYDESTTVREKIPGFFVLEQEFMLDGPQLRNWTQKINFDANKGWFSSNFLGEKQTTAYNIMGQQDYVSKAWVDGAARISQNVTVSAGLFV